MKVLVVGSGGREHALAWKIAQSPRVNKVFVAPGNAGTMSVAENVPIRAMDFDGLASFAKEHDVDLTVVGPDDLLAGGIVDFFSVRDLRIFGPSKAAAQIETSKAFSKQLMQEAGIPTAKFKVFSDHPEASAYVREEGVPIVIKASGLALGKGVYVCQTLAEAEDALKEIMLDKMFGDSGSEVVVEEYLEGQEVSIHALCDGTDFQLLPPSQDHKQIGEGDAGPNTGGMGVIAPVPWVSEDMMKEIGETIVRPTLEALVKRGTPYCGVLYPGLKMTPRGPKVLEFNARFGDPECGVYMRLLKTDLLGMLEMSKASTDHIMIYHNVEWEDGYAVNVVLSSGGYPAAYKTGFPISGIEEAEKIPGIVVFHAGTKKEKDILVTSGGRVLGVSAMGKTLQEALDRAYVAADLIKFEGKYLRHDIGAKALS